MNTRRNKIFFGIKKTIYFLSIFVCIVTLCYQPITQTDKVHAQTVLGTGTNVDFPNLVQNTIQAITTTKEQSNGILSKILTGIAKQLMNKITLSTLNWINSGFEGNPTFVQNPQRFFNDFADQQRIQFLNIIGFNPYNYPFGRTFAQNFILSLQSKFQQNANFSLYGVLGQNTTYNQYINGCFSCGGWNGYLALSQPMNNPFGFTLAAQNELAQQTAGEEQSPIQEVRNQLEQAGGILTPSVCVPGQKGYVQKSEEEREKLKQEYLNYSALLKSASDDPFAFEGDVEFYKEQLALLDKEIKQSTCTEEKKISTTPGLAISNQLNNALGASWRQSELGTAFGTNLGSIIDATLNQVAQKGLSSFSKKLFGNNKLPTSQGQTIASLQSQLNNPDINSGDVIIDLEQHLVTGKPEEFDTNGNPTSYGPTDIDLLNEEIKARRQTLARLPLLPTALYNLDLCLPGPDLGWEGRLDTSAQKQADELAKKLAKGKNKAQQYLDQLTYEVQNLKWIISGRMFDTTLNIPGATDMSDTIAQARSITIEAKRNQEKVSSQVLLVARLNKMKQDYLNANTDEQRNKIAAQYFDIQSDLPTGESVRRAQTETETIDSYIKKVNDLIVQCGQEKQADGRYNDLGGVSIEASDTSDLDEPFRNIDLTSVAQTFSRTSDTDINSSVIDISGNTVVKKLKDTGKEITGDQELEIYGFTEVELAVLYALIEQKGQSVGEAISNVGVMPEGITLPQEFSTEVNTFCQEGINVGTKWVGKEDIFISCSNFYHTPNESIYFIDKNY